MSPAQQIVITGVGIYCPVGDSASQMVSALRESRGAVDQIRGFSTQGLKARHAAEIASHDPLSHFDPETASKLDWTSQFAVLAARNAIEDSGLAIKDISSVDTGLIAGVCAGGQGESPVQRDKDNPFQVDISRYQEVSHYQQTDALGGLLAMHGPRLTVSTACASSSTALGHAYDWLQSGVVKRVIVGGMDAFSISTYAGFYALGAMAEMPISPFSEGIGVTFGEGAGFVVLELLEDARGRDANLYGELYGHGDSGDAHHITAPAPSGEGLARAMKRSLRRSGLDATDIDYVNAHGTGTRDNDVAESIAIASALGDAPPISSSKSFFGHTLGAAGILEFIASMLCVREGFVPPTLNHSGNRPGCEHDYVPNTPRMGTFKTFMSNSAAFGGINASVAAGQVRPTQPRSVVPVDDILITGCGVVSPIGSGLDEFRNGLIKGESGLRTIDRFDTEGLTCRTAGLVQKFKPRKLVPTIDARRAVALNKYAMVAAGLAMQDAGVDARIHASERLGMVMGLMYGSIDVQEEFNNSLINDGIERLSAKHFPSMVISTIGGQVSQSFSLRGTNTTVVDGFTGGLNALIQGYELLRQDDELDAVVVVVADEIGRAMIEVFDQRGKLAGDSCTVYDTESSGFLLGEGAAAVVLERATSARSRGAKPYSTISGYGMTNDGVSPGTVGLSGQWLAKAIQQALESSRVSAEAIELVLGHGCGDPSYDARELDAFQRAFGRTDIPLSNLIGNLGRCGAASGIFSVVAACLSMKHRELYPTIGCSMNVGTLDVSPEYRYEQVIRRSLIAGSTENGNNAAIVLKAVEGA